MAEEIIAGEIPQREVPADGPPRHAWLNLRRVVLLTLIVVFGGLTGMGVRTYQRSAAIWRLRKLPGGGGGPEGAPSVEAQPRAWHKSVSQWRRTLPKWLNRTVYQGLTYVPDAWSQEVRAVSLPQSIATDADMQHLWHLPELRSLNIRKTKVTDASLPALLSLKRLTFLNIRNTQISEAGFERLKAALPEAKIYWAR